MQPDMRRWLTSVVNGILLAIEMKTPGHVPPGVAAAAAFAQVFGPDATKVTAAEELAAVRLAAGRVTAPPGSDDGRARAATLEVCGAIDADDGSEAALARFRRAVQRREVHNARLRLRHVTTLGSSSPAERDGPWRGAEHPGLAGFLRHSPLAHAAIGGGHEAPEVDGAPLAAWLRAAALRPGAEGVAGPVLAFLDEAEGDDGTPAGWARLTGAFTRYLRATARLELERALQALGS